MARRACEDWREVKDKESKRRYAAKLAEIASGIRRASGKGARMILPSFDRDLPLGPHCPMAVVELPFMYPFKIATHIGFSADSKDPQWYSELVGSYLLERREEKVESRDWLPDVNDGLKSTLPSSEEHGYLLLSRGPKAKKGARDIGAVHGENFLVQCAEGLKKAALDVLDKECRADTISEGDTKAVPTVAKPSPDGPKPAGANDSVRVE